MICYGLKLVKSYREGGLKKSWKDWKDYGEGL